jgi:hypothetical protein
VSDRVHEVIFGLTTGTFSTYPPEVYEGVPSSATCEVREHSDSDDDAATAPGGFTPSVTIESIGTAGTATVDVVSGYSTTNRRKLWLDATTSIAVGGRYLLSNVYGQREIVTPTLVVANDYLELDGDLAYDYPVTTSTLKGFKLTCTVDATWVAAETNISRPGEPPYRVRWQYTVNSSVRRHFTYLRLVRQHAKHGVTLTDLRRMYHDLPGEEEAGGGRGVAFRAAIDFAYGELRSDIKHAGYDPDQVHDTETIDQLVTRRTFWNLAVKRQLPGSDPVGAAAHWKEQYRSLFSSSFGAALNVNITENTEGTTAIAPFVQPHVLR